MSLTFEWDPGKAERNLQKHGVSFEEAASAFGDFYSRTIADPSSDEEHRYVLLGISHLARALVVIHTERGENIRIISARRAGESLEPMTTNRSEADEPLEEYDFSQGERGKYAKRFAEGTNVVVLDPDVARAFPDSKAVNEALRSLLPSTDDADAGE